MLVQSNLLVGADGHARITGFRLAVITGDMDYETTLDPQGCQWSAPEILRGEATSKEADIFSLAMVIIEVLHG